MNSGPASRPPRGRRRPRAVYDVGQDVDPRFSLANERTLLAWIRTALTMLAGSVGLQVVNLPYPAALERALSVALGLVAAGAAGYGWWRWQRSERAMRTGASLPDPRGGLVLVLVVVAVAALLAVWPT